MGAVPIDWQRMFQDEVNVPAYLSGFEPNKVRADGGWQSRTSLRTVTLDVEVVMQLARRTSGGSVDADAPLMEAGVDSLGAVELRNQLQRAAGERAALSSTLVLTTRRRASWRSICRAATALWCMVWREAT